MAQTTPIAIVATQVQLTFFSLPAILSNTFSKLEEGVKIFPNPVKEKLTISVQSDILPAAIRIMDMTGKVFHQEVIDSNEQQLFLSCPAGVYLLFIQSHFGATMVRSVVKK